MQQRSKIYVVDSDSLVRNAASRVIQAMGLEWEGFACGREFMDAYDPNQHGCLISEVRIPDIGGLHIQAWLADQEAPLPVIFLSAYASVPVVVRAMQAGAVDFFEKPLVEQELWDAIQEALQVDQRRRSLCEERAELAERLASLTPGEWYVLDLLSRQSSPRRIAAELGVSVRTVELRRSRIMKKLGFDVLPELLQFVVAAAEGRSKQASVFGRRVNGHSLGEAWPGSNSTIRGFLLKNMCATPTARTENVSADGARGKARNCLHD